MSVIICPINLSEEQFARIRAAAPGHELLAGGDKERWQHRVQDAEIIIGWRRMFEETALGPETKLRWVQSWSAGVDALPLDRMAERGIHLTTTSGIHAYPISETILAMMLSYTRNLHIYARSQAAGRWDRTDPLLEMHGKTAGIIGFGAIGEETARLCRAFGMRVLGLRMSGRPSPHADEMYDASGLDQLLAESDYVIVTLPLTRETRRMFGREQFAKMKNTAMFINIGRGGLVDEQALIDALRDGEIAGAGLDVFEVEPLPEESPLWKMENVIITPHTAGGSSMYNERALEITLRNLHSYLQTGVPSVNLVDYAKQY